MKADVVFVCECGRQLRCATGSSVVCPEFERGLRKHWIDDDGKRSSRLFQRTDHRSVPLFRLFGGEPPGP